MIKYFNLLILCVFSLNANPLIEESNLSSTEGISNSFVDHSVCAISGEYVDHAVDLIIPGPTPLILQRSYRSSDRENGHLYKSWQLAEPNQLLISDNSFDPDQLKLVALVTTARGARARYKLTSNYRDDEKDFRFSHNKGYTNCSSGLMSASTNLKNNLLSMKFGKKGDITGILTSGDNCIRTYKYHYADSNDLARCALVSEAGTNKTKKHYFYSNIFDTETEFVYVNQIEMKNDSGSLHFGDLSFKHKKKLVTVQSSLGRQISYSFKKKHNTSETSYVDYYLEGVDNPTKPLEKYTYVESGESSKHLILSEKSLPDNRCKQIEYYQKGHNLVLGTDYNLKKHDPIIDRVKFLKAPVNQDSNIPVITHTFVYHFNQDKSGHTEVFDAHQNKTIYLYDLLQRLKETIVYNGNIFYSKESYNWDPEGKLISTTLADSSGQIKQAKVFDYDGKGNVVRLREYGVFTGSKTIPIKFNGDYPVDNGAEFLVSHFFYDDRNRLIREKDPSGKETHYAYLADSDLVTKKIVADTSGVTIAREMNHYDENYFLVSKSTDEGDGTRQLTAKYAPRLSAPFGYPEEMREIYYENGEEKLLHKTRNQHSPEGYLLSQEHYDSNNQLAYTLRWEYNAHGKITKEINALGYEVNRRYDDNDNLIWQQGPAKDCETHFTYDYSNRLTSKATYHADGHHLTESYRYDLLGNKIAQTDSYGNTTRYVFNALGRIITKEYPAVCNEHGNAINPLEKFEYDFLGNCHLKIDACGFSTAYENNVKGQPLKIYYPDGATEVFIYDVAGHIKRHTHQDLSYTVFDYDCIGHMLYKEHFSKDQVSLCKQSWEYSFNHLLSETNEAGLKTTYCYDAAGRLIEKTTLEKKTTYTYDPLNRLEKEIKWLNNQEAYVTFYKYDLLNRVIEESIQNLKGNTISSTKTHYDCYGNVVEVKTGNAISKTVYDSRQKPVKLIDAEGYETTIIHDYQYFNAFGQNVERIHTKDALGQTVITEYDALGRIHLTGCFAKDGKLLSKSTKFYNLNGDLSVDHYDRIIDGTTVSSMRIIREYDSTGKLISLNEDDHRMHKYQYNTFGQKTHDIRPDGSTILYTYDAKGRVFEIKASDNSLHYRYVYNLDDQIKFCEDLIHHNKTKRDYDDYGRLTEETLGNQLTIQFVYDLFDRKIKTYLPDGSSIDYSYDPFYLRSVTRNGYTHHYEKFDDQGNLLRSQLPYKAGFLEYTYDRNGHEISIAHPKRYQETSYDPLGNIIRIDVNTTIKKFAYDGLYQLTEEQDHTYLYDSLNNRIVKDNLSCTIDKLNLITSQDHVGYTYDIHGNRIFEDMTTYTYDAWNRLISSRKDGLLTTYVYDAFNRLLAKNNETYLFDGQDEIACFNGKKMTHLRVLGLSKTAEMGGAIAIEMNNQVYFPLHDQNGSVVALLDKNGNQIHEYSYTAFGIEQSKNSNPWRFCSKHFHEETNLIHFGCRFYDPFLGRFISPDPAEYDDGPNLYAYVHNNPLGHLDAYGLWELPSWQDTKDSFFSTFSSPRFQGSMEAFGGFAEASFGGAMTLASGGYAAPLGWPVMAHGLDHLFTGMQTVVTGRSRNSVTSQVLQEAGLSSETANLLDSSVSVAGSLGGVAIQRGGSGAISSLKVPQQELTKSQFRFFTQGNFNSQKKIDSLSKDLQFTNKALSHMSNPDRYVPRHILAKAIEGGSKSPDPRNASGGIKIVDKMFRNNKEYELNVIYNESQKKIYPFHYH